MSSFFGQVLGRLVSAKVFRPQLVSGLHVGLHNSAIPAGFSQNILAVHKWIQSGYILYGQWPDRRGAAHQNVRALTKKSKSEIGSHHGIFLCRHLGDIYNTTLLPK